MKKIYYNLLLGISISTLTPLTNFAQSSTDSVFIAHLGKDIMEQDYAYNNLRYLCKKIGNRISGSKAAEEAIAWGQKALKEAGADHVYLQKVMVPVWQRGKESLHINLNGKRIPIEMLSLGNTQGTDGKLLSAPVVEFNSVEALNNSLTENVKGKIVFINQKFPQGVFNTFDAYSMMYRVRWDGAGAAAAKGAKGLIIRSISTGLDDAPHTGTAHYRDSLPKIPAIAIGNTTADQLSNWCKTQQPIAEIISNCKLLGEKLSYNVIGEFKGIKNPNQFIVVGGHLDSWDIGEGAHDDGAGIVQSIEVLRSLKAQNYKPNNTIRVVLFMNEENGNRGGNAYADSVKANNEPHLFALESDAGGFTPRGIGMELSSEKRLQIQSWKSLLEPFGLYDFSKIGSGVDIGPLKKLGIPVAELIPDSHRYFDLHHSRNDVFEAVNIRELNMGAAGMAALIYLIDKNW